MEGSDGEQRLQLLLDAVVTIGADLSLDSVLQRIVRIAKTAGFDSIYVDLEHSSFDFDTTGQICMMALEAGIAPFVRVPTNKPEYIARALDGGAMGIIAPDIQSAEDARAAGTWPAAADRIAATHPVCPRSTPARVTLVPSTSSRLLPQKL